MTRLAFGGALLGLLLLGCAPKAEKAPEQPAAAPGGEQKAPAAAPGAAQDQRESDQLQTPIARSLSDALKKVQTNDRDTKDQLQKILRESDPELAKVLNGNSKSLILQANNKPPVPSIVEPNCPLPQTRQAESGTKSQETEKPAETPSQEPAPGQPAES